MLTPERMPMVMQNGLFTKADGLLRANACACATLCAEVRIDRILVALRDSLRRALADTCSTCDAIVTNYVCHNNVKI